MCWKKINCFVFCETENFLFSGDRAHTLEFTPRWGTQNIIDKYFQAYAQRKKERLIYQDVNATAAAAENMKLYDWIVFYSGKNSSENGHKIAGAKNERNAYFVDANRMIAVGKVSDNEIVLPPVDFPWIERWLQFDAPQIGPIVIHYTKLNFNTVPIVAYHHVRNQTQMILSNLKLVSSEWDLLN